MNSSRLSFFSRFATPHVTRCHFSALIPVACTLSLAFSSQAAALALLDESGGRLGESAEAKSSITFTPTEGSGDYTVTAGANASGAVGTIKANGDGSYTFTRPVDGAFAGYYRVTVTDNAGGDSCGLSVAVPPAMYVSRPDMLGIGDNAYVSMRGAAAGVTFTVRALDQSGNDVTGVLATFEGDPTAWDMPAAGNSADVTLIPQNPAEDTKLRVVATAPGLPRGDSGLVTIIAAELYRGTVVGADGPIWGASVVAEGRRSATNDAFGGWVSWEGNFEFAGPKGTATIVAGAHGYGQASAVAADCLSGCAMTLGAAGTDQLIGQRMSPLVDSRPMHLDLAGFATLPVVITGVPTSNGMDPGVARVSNVKKTGFDLRFAEWEYLDGRHGEETVDALALAPGRYNLSDGSVWEVGSFTLGNTGIFRDVSFSAPFLGLPRLFLTVQTENDADVVTVRAKGVTAAGFRAALYEQEAKMDGHRVERVGYVAIYHPAGSGRVNFAGTEVYYQMWGTRLTGAFRDIWDGVLSYRLQEERSLDAEIEHPYEAVDVMYFDGAMLGQDVSSRNRDTVSLRLRHGRYQ